MPVAPWFIPGWNKGTLEASRWRWVVPAQGSAGQRDPRSWAGAGGTLPKVAGWLRVALPAVKGASPEDVGNDD